MITQKVFTDELENRIDPHYYKPEFLRLISQMSEGGKHLKPLSEVSVKIASGATPLSGGSAYTDKASGIPFIRSGDINEDETINYNDILYIKESIHNKKLKSSKLQKDDVLIAIVGATIGQVSVYKENEEANINQAIALVRCSQEINPRYVKAFLLSEIGQKQLERIKRPVARANINLEEVGSIKIPVIPLELQGKIADIIQKAYLEKEEKLKQADELLNSIDDFVRQQLGIDYTEPEEKKTYPVNANELQNKRHDPYYYKPNFIALEKMLLSNKAVKLSILLKSITNGLDYRKFSDDGTLNYLRVSNVRPYGIDYTEVKKVRLSQSDISKNIFGKKNDILLTRKGTYGISVSLGEDLNALISSEIFLLKIDTEKVNPHYLSIFLNSSLGQKQFLRNKVGAIMGSLSQEAVKDTYVVIPSIGKQLDITKEVEERLKKASELRQKGEQITEEAKKEIEEMILN